MSAPLELLFTRRSLLCEHLLAAHLLHLAQTTRSCHICRYHARSFDSSVDHVCSHGHSQYVHCAQIGRLPADPFLSIQDGNHQAYHCRWMSALDYWLWSGNHVRAVYTIGWRHCHSSRSRDSIRKCVSVWSGRSSSYRSSTRSRCHNG